MLDSFLNNVPLLIVLVLVIVTLYMAVKIVPQSRVYVIERFGRYTRTLQPGLTVVVPFLDKVRYDVSILERQLAEFTISVITKDNVEVHLDSTVFYRVVDASRMVYRIRDVNAAIHTAASSIVRSAAGKLELDELQSSREAMNEEIAKNLRGAAEVWGVEITRTEITDVTVDEQTKVAQRQQLNAERERRAAIARAEGQKRSVELTADGQLYEAQKLADAVRIEADASAYAVKVKAEADARQTRLIADAIAENGQPAVNFEIMKRQVEALGSIASSNATKTLIIPTQIAGVLGSIETLMSVMSDNSSPKQVPAKEISAKKTSSQKKSSPSPQDGPWT